MKNIHVLPTSIKTSDFIQNNRGIHRITENFTQSDLDFIQAKFVNIYITSDEEIKEGDWILDNILANKKPIRVTKELLEDGFLKEDKKIILTTDQDLIKDGVQDIDDEFLEWFIKNPSCENVEISSEILYEHKDTYRPYPSECKNLTKTKVNYYLSIIPKEKPKQETLEEVAERLYYSVGNEGISSKESFINGAKWQQERSYSEDEVIRFLYKRRIYQDHFESYAEAREWFNKFKKK